MRTVASYMTRHPFTIGHDITLAVAHEKMREHHVRHLPVLDGGKLVGVISQRDLYFLETFPDVKLDEVRVEEAMTSDPYVVDPGAELATVVEEMIRRKLGTAIVVERDAVIGIFTAIDGLRALIDSERAAA